MPYASFAYWYDDLNTEADYDKLCSEIVQQLVQHNIKDGIVADLGCGTGEVSLRMANAGYDMIGVDASEDMLSVFRQKITSQQNDKILLLLQDLAELDLFGTIRAAVSTFDTFNHLPPPQLKTALAKAALFLEDDGLLVFDANTPYKHQEILNNRQFILEDGQGLVCTWNNEGVPNEAATRITLTVAENGETLFTESFCEYIYPLEWWQQNLADAGFTIVTVQDGETFAPLTETSQRYFIVAKKQNKE